MPSPCIPDGYTRGGTLAATADRPPVRFEYRPMLTADREMLAERVNTLMLEEAGGLAAIDQLMIRELDRRLVSWTLLDERGHSLPISCATLVALDAELLEGLAEIVLGLTAGGAEREAIDEKNCGAGCGSSCSHPASHCATATTACCTSTTKTPVAGQCMAGARSCGRPAHTPRAGCRTSAARKGLRNIRAPSPRKTSALFASTASAARWGNFLTTRSSAGTHC